MSELVKRWKEAQCCCEVCMIESGNNMADEIERLEKEVLRLQSLAVCSSDEGTCFYYKDEFEAMRKERDELKESVRRCFPFGDDGMTIDEVLKELKDCAHEIAFARPESPIEFMDGETLRTIIYEEGDSSVGIQGGYVTDDEIDLDELKARLAKYENDQPSFSDIAQAIPVYGCPVTTFKKESK